MLNPRFLHKLVVLLAVLQPNMRAQAARWGAPVLWRSSPWSWPRCSSSRSTPSFLRQSRPLPGKERQRRKEAGLAVRFNAVRRYVLLASIPIVALLRLGRSVHMMLKAGKSAPERPSPSFEVHLVSYLAGHSDATWRERVSLTRRARIIGPESRASLGPIPSPGCFCR